MTDASLTELLPRVFLSMAAVIAVMAIAARLLRGRQIPGSGGMRLTSQAAKQRNPIEVVARQTLGRHASVAIVRAGGKAFVVGITEQQISLLTQLDELSLVDPEIDIQGTDVDIDAATNAATSPSWKGLLTQVRESTVRR